MISTSISKPRYYVNDQNVNPVGFLAALALLCIVSFLLGYIYAVALMLIPIVYVSSLITIGAALALGASNRFAMRLMHIRNKKNKYALALLSGLLISYFQWTAYLTYVYSGAIPTPMEYSLSITWILYPTEFISAILEVNQHGVWSIFGVTFHGVALTLIWIIELILLTGSPLLSIYKSEDNPYSTIFTCWYPKFTLRYDFESISMAGKLTADLQQDPFGTLTQLKLGNGFRHAKVHIYFLPKEETQFLTVENIFIEGRGSGTKNKTTIVHNLAIETATASNLMNHFGFKREWIDVL